MKRILSSVILLSFLLSNPLFSQKCYQPNNENQLSKTTGSPSRTNFNINNISTWIYNNGDTDMKPDGNSGFEYPKGSGNYGIFESGIVWGGKINGQIHVGGSTYSQGLLPGSILENGEREISVDGDHVRIYRVRTDWQSGDVSAEMRDENKTVGEIRTQYELDWNEWPAEYGAPFTDINDDGNYNPGIDIPGEPNAHQTIWYVANDLDLVTSRSLYGSDPMGVELQVTIWGYNIPGYLENVMFKKYKIINKNSIEFTDMYVTQWHDIDLGDAGDDFQGVDSLLNIIYGYNGDVHDEDYGLISPSIGFQFLQGPIVESSGSTAYVNGTAISGYKNLGITSNYFYLCGGPLPWVDPALGEYNIGTLKMYNHMQGIHFDGSSIEIPEEYGGGITKLSLTGNPIIGEGWLDGYLRPPCDIRGIASSGPFNIPIGEGQEIVIAQIAAQGKDHLNSIAVLKYYASLLQQDYPNLPTQIEKPNLANYIPSITNANSSQEIKINIERTNEIENFSQLGFTFQGYKLYQLQEKTNNPLSGLGILTFDLEDEITSITGETFDPQTGYIISDIIFNGTNSGIPNMISVDKDNLNNSKLLKGKPYYYGLSACFYNSSTNELLESKLNPLEIIFKETIDGASYQDRILTNHSSGIADIKVDLEVYDADELTGDIYEITFGEQHYYLDNDGSWKKTNYPDSIGKTLLKPADLTGSTLIPLASEYAPNNTMNLRFETEIVSKDFDGYNDSDSIKITFPNEIVINSAKFDRSYVNPNLITKIEDQTVTWIYEYSTIKDGEILFVNVNFKDPIFAVNFEIFDSKDVQNIINALGSVILTGEISNQFKTERYWNLHNKTKNETALEYQSIFNGRDINSGNWAEYGYEPIVDGFRIKLDGTFDNPKTYYQAVINDEQLNLIYPGQNIRNARFEITDYTYFGYENGTSFFANGYGTKDPVKLSQDYEFRFTGKRDSTIINGKKVYITKDGTGSLATCYGARNYDYTYHPLNNSGPNRFLVRIPFEVWNKDLGIQVNYQFYDRSQLDPTADGFYVWNPNGRMYGEILNTPYTGLLISQTMTETLSDEFTWNNVWSKSNYVTGDIVEINYRNPIQPNEVITFNSNDIISSLNYNVPLEYILCNNYPNPFNPTTKIRYSLPIDSKVNISIYNILGQKVTELVNKSLKAGEYEAVFNASNCASGVYIYRIKTENFMQSKKMMFLK